MNKNTKKLLSLILSLLLIITMFPICAFATKTSPATGFADGDGTEENPYIIKTAEQLLYFANSVNDGISQYNFEYIKLNNDISLNDTANWENWDEWGEYVPENIWEPIGYEDAENGIYNSFGGTFDGDGHTVSGIYINNDKDNQGLFGNVHFGTVKNVSVEKSFIHGNDSVGGIVGSGYYAKIKNCSSSAAVGGYWAVGGIAGRLDECDEISSCYNAGTVSGNSNVGGIVGYYSAYNSENVPITKCYNTGNISGNQTIGGVVGRCEKISQCYNIGNVTGSYKFGGIAGDNGDAVTECYYLDTCVTSPKNTEGTALSKTQMKNAESYENWSFESTWEMGFDISYDYPTLRCFGSKTYNYRFTVIDGENVIINKTVSGDAIKLTEAPCQNENADFVGYKRDDGLIIYLGDEFYPEFDADYFVIWKGKNVSENVWNGTSDTEWQGDGTSGNPYLITCAEELSGLAEKVNEGNSYSGKYFKLADDILLNDNGEKLSEYFIGKNSWISIGNDENSFDGTFDGDGHAVSGMYIDLLDAYASECAGLFGNIGADGTVKNLKVDKFYITNNSDVGGVASYSKGTVSDCFASGKSYGYFEIAGVVGKNEGTVKNCTNEGYVNGLFSVAGVVGETHGDVTGCTNKGDVVCEEEYGCVAGGVVGNAYGAVISECLNTGNVSSYYTAGGVIGATNDSTVKDCHNKGYVFSNPLAKATEHMSTGGVIGGNRGTVINCSNEHEVTGRYHVGGIVGNLQSGSISKCYNNAVINGDTRGTGGILGTGFDEISECYNTGVINGNENVGGIAGYNDGKTVNCHNEGEVNGDYNVGGICGFQSGSIVKCHNTATVNGKSIRVGGISGDNSGTVECCYNEGNVNSVDKGDYIFVSVGGVVGQNNSTVLNCYNKGVVTGSSTSESTKIYSGGIVGHNFYGNILKSYNVGKVIGSYYAGGVLGYEDTDYNQEHGEIKDCYYLISSVEDTINTIGTPLSDTEMQYPESFTGFNFETVWEMGKKEDYKYPVLKTTSSGDSNGDGVIDATDLVRLKKYLAGQKVEINETGADCNGDGVVDATDLVRLKKFLAGQSVVLGRDK